MLLSVFDNHVKSRQLLYMLSTAFDSPFQAPFCFGGSWYPLPSLILMSPFYSHLIACIHMADYPALLCSAVRAWLPPNRTGNFCGCKISWKGCKRNSQFLLHISLDKAIDHTFMCHTSQLSDSVKFENLDLVTTSFQHGNSLPPRWVFSIKIMHWVSKINKKNSQNGVVRIVIGHS